MSYMRPYHIKCVLHRTHPDLIDGEINAVVTAGNTKVAVKKFMMHLPDPKNAIDPTLLDMIMNADHHFTKRYEDIDITESTRKYVNKDGTMIITVRKVHSASEFIFVESHMS